MNLPYGKSTHEWCKCMTHVLQFVHKPCVREFVVKVLWRQSMSWWGPFALVKLSWLCSGWVQDNALTHDHPGMDVSHTQLSSRVELNTAFVRFYAICCLERWAVVWRHSRRKTLSEQCCCQIDWGLVQSADVNAAAPTLPLLSQARPAWSVNGASTDATDGVCLGQGTDGKNASKMCYKCCLVMCVYIYIYI